MGTIDLNALPLFKTLAETCSFSATAKQHRHPKSKVSRDIAALESALGLRLFHRSTRKVSLSTAGAAFLDRVSSSLHALQTATADWPEQQEEPAGRIRVTAPTDLGGAVLAEIATRFSRRYPAVELEMHLTNRAIDLVAEGFDLALRIATKPLKDSALVGKKSGEVRLLLYAAPSYLARTKLPRTPQDLAHHSWVRFGSERTLKLASQNEIEHVQIRGNLQSSDMLFIHEALCQGAGIGVLPTFLANDSVAAGRLTQVLPRWSAPSGSLWILHHRAKVEPRKITAFREFVLESICNRPLGLRV
jgi:DNA-binding transcriptional LysR family regulator